MNIMWNIITIVISTIALFWNSYMWMKYWNNTNKEEREKEGWNSYFLVSTFFIISVLLTRIGKM
jgi:hypothetical protein